MLSLVEHEQEGMQSIEFQRQTVNRLGSAADPTSKKKKRGYLSGFETYKHI